MNVSDRLQYQLLRALSWDKYNFAYCAISAKVMLWVILRNNITQSLVHILSPRVSTIFIYTQYLWHDEKLVILIFFLATLLLPNSDVPRYRKNSRVVAQLDLSFPISPQEDLRDLLPNNMSLRVNLRMILQKINTNVFKFKKIHIAPL